VGTDRVRSRCHQSGADRCGTRHTTPERHPIIVVAPSVVGAGQEVEIGTCMTIAYPLSTLPVTVGDSLVVPSLKTRSVSSETLA
jgi:hypothetical protein